MTGEDRSPALGGSTTVTEADRELMRRAREVQGRAHAPHSGFRVGAAVRTHSGAIYPGCNVESVTYGLTLCAERVAIFSALSDGDTDIEAVAVAVVTGQSALPCGACRQILAEFAATARVVLATENGDLRVLTVGDLLPDPPPPGGRGPEGGEDRGADRSEETGDD